MTMEIGWNVAQYASDTQYQRDLDVAAYITPGTLIRLDAVNEYVRQANGSYDWSELDRKIGRITDRALGVHLMIPYWTRGNDKAQPDDATTISQHVAFCDALGTRYQNAVTSAELGNEANRKGDFAPDGAKPVLQGKIAVQVAAVLPSAWTLVSMGCAPAPTADGSMSPLDYVKGGYWKIAGHVFDACAVHPYGRKQDAKQSWSTLGQVPKLHRFTGKPIWATEYNAWSGRDDLDRTWVTDTLPWLANRKAGDPQVAYVPWTFMFAMSDPSTDAAGQPHLGLIDGNDNPRPAFSGVADYLG